MRCCWLPLSLLQSDAVSVWMRACRFFGARCEENMMSMFLLASTESVSLSFGCCIYATFGSCATAANLIFCCLETTTLLITCSIRWLRFHPAMMMHSAWVELRADAGVDNHLLFVCLLMCVVCVFIWILALKSNQVASLSAYALHCLPNKHTTKEIICSYRGLASVAESHFKSLVLKTWFTVGAGPATNAAILCPNHKYAARGKKHHRTSPPRFCFWYIFIGFHVRLCNVPHPHLHNLHLQRASIAHIFESARARKRLIDNVAAKWWVLCAVCRC